MRDKPVSILTLVGAITVLSFLVGSFATCETSAQDSYTGQWIIEPARTAGRYQVTFTYQSTRSGRGHSMSGFTIEPERFQGLTQTQIMSAGSRVQFQLVRDAGTLNCEGWFKDGKGSGHFVFAASPTFAGELQRRGYPAPTEAQQFSMTLSDLSLVLIDELKTQGYERPSLDQLVRMGEHGVTSEYIRELKAQGYSVQSVDLLTRMVDHGVNPKFIRELDALGFKQLPVETLIRTVDHGVTPRFINDLAAEGYTGLSLDQLIRTVDHGVTPKFITELKEIGFDKLPIEQLVRMQDHGVTVKFIQKMRSRGFNDASIDELIKLADHGMNNLRLLKPSAILPRSRPVRHDSESIAEPPKLINRPERGAAFGLCPRLSVQCLKRP